MSRKSLKVLFHMGIKEYKEEYERRFNNEYTIHLPIKIGSNAAFICQTPEIYNKIINILQLDKAVSLLSRELPGVVLNKFTNDCLIDEIVLTNKIEGVHSTRKEIGTILHDLSSQNKRNRFVGIVAKYESLMQRSEIQLKTCHDIRKIYDDIFYDEIEANDPKDLPDGEIFRKSSVDVVSETQKVIHQGVMPESKIIDSMEQSLLVLNDDSINIFIRIAVFHYLFGYIHPFYDGNGRTSRFISSYLLSQQLDSLIGFRLSTTIRENLHDYHEAFKICNSTQNKGELTSFVEMFLGIIEKSMKQLLNILKEKDIQLSFYYQHVLDLPNSDKKPLDNIYFILIQAALFSNIGICRSELKELMKETKNISDGTLRKRLELIPKQLLIENKQNRKKYYLLNLEEADKLFDV